LQDPPKYTQIWTFGLKTNHLATLFLSSVENRDANLFIVSCRDLFCEPISGRANHNLQKSQNGTEVEEKWGQHE
jgi:hypothetical protein